VVVVLSSAHTGRVGVLDDPWVLKNLVERQPLGRVLDQHLCTTIDDYLNLKHPFSLRDKGEKQKTSLPGKSNPLQRAKRMVSVGTSSRLLLSCIQVKDRFRNSSRPLVSRSQSLCNTYILMINRKKPWI
jgi:hypothetical protein